MKPILYTILFINFTTAFNVLAFDNDTRCRRFFDTNPLHIYTDNYILKAMNEEYHDRDPEEAVIYISPKGKFKYLIHFKDGRLFDYLGEPLNLTEYSHAYIMDEHGDLYAEIPEVQSGEEIGFFHHSSFLAGAPVAAAGTIIVEEGILLKIDDRSGHYSPEERFLEQTLKRLDEHNVDLSSVMIISQNKNKNPGYRRNRVKKFIKEKILKVMVLKLKY